MLTHKQLRTQALADVAVKAEFDKLSDEFSLLDEFLKARTSQGLTQAQVAEKIGTTQSAVARIPDGHPKCPTYGHPNCSTRPEVTRCTDMCVSVTLWPTGRTLLSPSHQREGHWSERLEATLANHHMDAVAGQCQPAR